MKYSQPMNRLLTDSRIQISISFADKSPVPREKLSYVYVHSKSICSLGYMSVFMNRVCPRDAVCNIYVCDEQGAHCVCAEMCMYLNSASTV